MDLPGFRSQVVAWGFWSINSGGAVPRPQEIPNQFSALCHNPELQAISVTGPVEFWKIAKNTMAMAIKIQAFMWWNIDILVQWILQSHIRRHKYASQFAEPNQKDPLILPRSINLNLQQLQNTSNPVERDPSWGPSKKLLPKSWGPARFMCVFPFFGWFLKTRDRWQLKDFLNFSSRTPWGCDPIGRLAHIFSDGWRKTTNFRKTWSAV